MNLSPPIFVGNTFGITFEYKKEIRRCANDIEDSLKRVASSLGGGYNVPIVTPIPDEVDPNAPRLIFNSLHGFSQIVFNQTGVTLNVSYSDDYMIADSAGLRKDYLYIRMCILHKILEEIGCVVLFSGIVSRVLILTEDNENELLGFLSSFIPEKYRTDLPYESMFRKAEILENKFFNIFQVSSYREIPAGQNPFLVPRLPAINSVKRGIELVHDINDRYSYNENKDYFTSLEVSENILERSEGIIQQFLGKFYSLKGVE